MAKILGDTARADWKNIAYGNLLHTGTEQLLHMEIYCTLFITWAMI